MKTIQPYIDLGFYTVPLKGELKRKSNGKKTIPGFEKDWREKNTETFNETATRLGGTITGSVSGCIAIDCDSSDTYSLFKSLDTDNKFHFVSKGKPEGGGTIMYSYPNPEHVIPSFSIQSDTLKLDFYSDNGFVYLPTDSNHTKARWKQETLEELPKLLGMPPAVYTLLNTLHAQEQLVKQKKKDSPQMDMKTALTPSQANYLAPTISLMMDKNAFSTTLFRIITPKDFRSESQYVKHGYLHPNNVPNGRGSEYMSKVSAILGRDSSVDKQLYLKAMKFINELWDEPIDNGTFRNTITDPMSNEEASIDGEQIWQYDDNWETRGFSFINKLGEAVEVFFDDIRSQYYLVNFTRNTLTKYFKDTEVFSYIDTIGLGLPNRKEYKSIMPIVRTVNNPAQEFGFYKMDEYTRQFNTFNQTPALKVLNNPDTYSLMYKRPDVTLKFMRSLIPNSQTREHVLRFLRKKLTTFDYSPTILYFLGVPGSGKDTFVSILSSILGVEYVAKPSAREFLEQYNGWIVDKYFVQLDEYGNQLSRFVDKQEALGKIKAYSGKKDIQIRQMRTDGFNYNHHSTFIMTANTNPLLLEEGDRRACVIDTPNKMMGQDWVEAAGGLKDVHNCIERETLDFCYYLATEVDDIDYDLYMTPPDSKTKHNIIASSLPAGQRLAYMFKHSMFDTIERLMDEYDVGHLLSHADEQRVYEDDLFELYSCMTDNAGVKRGLSVAMSDADIKKIPTTQSGAKTYYFQIRTLQYYAPHNGGFDNIETEV